MHLAKAEIIATLRSRGLHARADWADRALPELVDIRRNNSLLEMLGIHRPAGATDRATTDRTTAETGTADRATAELGTAEKVGSSRR